jgi:hypothetical protein
MKTLALAAAGGFALALLASTALADPPGRVGRVSAVEGDVSFLPPGEQDWTYASRNYPVTEGESFWTGDEGRAQLQVGVMEVSADSDTEVDVLALTYGQTRLSIPQGSINLHLWELPRGGVALATPAGDVLINAPGDYRLDVGAMNDDGSYPPVEITVFQGDASAPAPEGYMDVGDGSAAVIYAGYDPQMTDVQDASIDDWARQRESREQWRDQADYSPGLTGYDELAANGDFSDDPDYGRVWYPNAVPADWAPYRYGHWAYVAPWGYTWIDDQPWGFAPFHYGRWVQVEGRWGWVAGAPTREPVYAPALVAFIGGFGGSIGWIPLAPNEVFRPTYQVSETYIRQVNITNVNTTVINNITVNRVTNVTELRNARAAVAVRPETLASGAAVGRSAAPVRPEMLANAKPAAASPELLPRPAPVARLGGATVAERATRPAAPPPQRLQAVRAAVAAQPRQSTRPPTIPGARVSPPAPRPAGAPAFIAPAQIKHPAAQGLSPAPTRRLGSPPVTRPMLPTPNSAPPAPRERTPVRPAYERPVPPTMAPVERPARPAYERPVPPTMAPVERPARPAYERPLPPTTAPVERPARPAYQRPVPPAAAPVERPVRPAYQRPVPPAAAPEDVRPAPRPPERNVQLPDKRKDKKDQPPPPQ